MGSALCILLTAALQELHRVTERVRSHLRLIISSSHSSQASSPIVTSRKPVPDCVVPLFCWHATSNSPWTSSSGLAKTRNSESLTSIRRICIEGEEETPHRGIVMAAFQANKNDGNRRHAAGNNLTCLTMHQPWASLLVYGIKRVEGRTWNTDFRGTLWIHAASTQPTAEEIAEVEDFYRNIYALEGLEDVTFPQFYPTSCLLGCVEVVDVLARDDYKRLPAISDSLRKESDADFVFLCESPKRLVMPFQMSGQHKLWQLPKKTAQDAALGLKSVQAPLTTSFPVRR